MDSNNYLPLQRRLAKIRRKILFLIRPIKKKMIRKRYEAIRRKDKLGGEGHWEWARQAITPIRDELKSLLRDVDSWLSVDYVQCYLNTLGDNERQISAAALAQNQVLFEDVAPLLYIKGELEGFPAKRDIRHVVVDEAQDYSPLQLTIIRKLFPNSKFTILGDGHQCLNPALGKYRDLSSAAQVFDPAGVGHIRLTKTYRSTQEITSFCLSLRSQDNQQDSEPVVRHGEKPLLIKVQPSSLGQEVISRIHDLQEQGHKSIAVICTTVSQCKEAYVHLQPEFDPFLVDHADKKYHQGLIIIPVYLAKGLEFDAVLIWDAGAGNYSKEYHRNQLYTACSRALHQLYICYSGELSPFIAAVHKELYRRPEHKKGG